MKSFSRSLRRRHRHIGGAQHARPGGFEATAGGDQADQLGAGVAVERHRLLNVRGLSDPLHDVPDPHRGGGDRGGGAVAVEAGGGAREGEVRVRQQGRVDRAQGVDAADRAKVFVILLRDHDDVVLGFLERRHAPMLLHVARPGVVGRERVNDVPVEHIQHVRQVARAAFDLQVRAIVVRGVDAEVARRSRHDLRQTKGPDRRARADGEATFLPDQGLQQAAPLDDGQTGLCHAWPPMRFLRHADDELLDVDCGIAEHFRAARIGVVGAVERVGRLLRQRPAFEARHHFRDTLTAEASLSVEYLLQHRELVALDRGNLFLDGQRFALRSEVGFAADVRSLVPDDEATVHGRHALAGGRRRPDQRECRGGSDPNHRARLPERLRTPPRTPCRAPPSCVNVQSGFEGPRVTKLKQFAFDGV